MCKSVAMLVVSALALASGEASLEQARTLYEQANYRTVIERLRTPDTADGASWALLGQARYQLGHYSDAYKALKKAVDAAPENAEYWDWLGKAYGRQAETGSFFRAFGFARKCRRAFEKAVELAPENIEALDDLFSYYLDAPGILGGGVDKAEKIADRVAKLDAAEHEYLLAALARKRKDYAVAERHYRKALELEPGRVGRLLDLAAFLSERRRFEESDALFARAALLAPDSPNVMFARAEAAIRAKRNTGEARHLLEFYLDARLTSDDPPRHQARALLKKVEGR